ncbi:MAG: 50S ribosomal protein L10 [Alphaproteobacteria bacterium]|nr:MAG: 50S ribosomal protein L10 [Alphaproteobacteria bacterium]
MQRQEKEVFVSDLSHQFHSVEAVFVTKQSGLSVAQATVLRQRIRSVGANYRVAKNTLVRRALEGTAFEALLGVFSGPTAVTFATDPVAAAKAIVDFSQANEKIEVIAGVMGGVLLSRDEVVALSKLPSLDQLRGMLIALISTPATRIARLASEPAAMTARLISAYAEANK